jgi:hypothetical protein
VPPKQDDGYDDAEEQERGAMVQCADPHERHGVGGDQAGVPEADERQEQTDATCRRDPQPWRNRHRHVLPERGGRDEQEQHARPEHHPEGRLPRHLVLQHDGVREEGIESHSRRHSEREPRIQPHQQGHGEGDEDRGRQRSGKGNARAGRGQDAGIDHHDVRHREEGGDSSGEIPELRGGRGSGSHAGLL